MTATPPKNAEELLSDSWIEFSNNGIKSPGRVTPLPFTFGEEYLRLLREAQRESNQSSRVVSLTSSRRDTPKESPKSPPNSPNFTDEELRGVYVNYWNKEGGEYVNFNNADWIWEWSSRPDQLPPKGWNFQHPRRRPGYSMRLARVGNNSLFSREVLYSLLLTNVLSLIIGAGVGVWLSKRGVGFIFGNITQLE
ncbi:BCL2/adenovirus E1B 19 kDa protein-interacting protein 3 [Sitodiplosis mosellana]|uniref:BCL2/adenovirus E1B 19 kDa protein-interacting protein 3 n=1 Tax=Sitodiplosis mosellana TaxID=263140 RepID=UPI00244433BF|nr:BCL2/adenovirus E1B 19 kDa protein-interacting protein 3 [Sitodiplosis mosellana]